MILGNVKHSNSLGGQDFLDICNQLSLLKRTYLEYLKIFAYNTGGILPSYRVFTG